MRIGLSPFYSRQGTHATNGLHEIQHADFSSAYNSVNNTSKSLFILAYLVGIFHISSEYSRFNRNIPHYSNFVGIFHNFHMSEYSIFRRIRKMLFRSNTITECCGFQKIDGNTSKFHSNKWSFLIRVTFFNNLILADAPCELKTKWVSSARPSIYICVNSCRSAERTGPA